MPSIHRILLILILSALLVLFCIVFIISDALLHATSMRSPGRFLPKSDAGGAHFLSEISDKVYVDFEELKQPIVDLDPKCPRWTEMAQAYRRCLAKQMAASIRNHTLWFYVHLSLRLCGGDLIKHILHVKYLANKDDMKLVVLPPHTKHTPCTVVTIGIGNDTRAEQRLKRLLPAARFFGADPVRGSGAVFEQLGRFNQVAIANTSRELNASVLIDGSYSWTTVQAMSLLQYLKSLPVKQVDFLFLDAEGVEYDIIPQLEYINEFVTLCQLSIEMHGPLHVYGQTNVTFANSMLKFFTASRFIPIWAPQPMMHNRFFVINWKDAYCINKFFYKWC